MSLHPFFGSVFTPTKERGANKQTQLTLELIWGYSYLQATTDLPGFQNQQLEVREHRPQNKN